MNDVPGRIEHTVLGPTTTGEDVTTALDIALRDGMRACLPPCYVAEAADYAPNVEIATVVGFPHGQHTTAAKCHEAREAWEDGANELDMVANIGYLHSEEDERLEQEIAEVVATVPIPVKVIVEAPLLDEEELRRACQTAVDADADFVKTATGFSEGGATVEDVEVMNEYLPVKASGGIGSWAEAKAMFDVGAERIGASSGDVIVAEYREAIEKPDAEDADR
ncbi:deoxyribose-phosphate aldolase [Salinibaculum salinum]|uniref:deoxyribose-phosphate aldolase n=1 Tax=Salinibaculum salinum TaxID=3131996 RepID=UPI0030EDB1F9